jgi:hypothetical protein
MFKILILAVQNNVASASIEYFIRDRLSWLHFLGFGPVASFTKKLKILIKRSPCFPNTFFNEMRGKKCPVASQSPFVLTIVKAELQPLSDRW